MRNRIPARLSLALLTVLVLFSLSSSAFGAATIVIVNGDAAGVGFNDTTPVAPIGGNPGTTLGQQRLNAFQFAANIWGATLNSTTTINVRATWEPLTCTSTSAVLGSAGAATIWRDFSGATFPGTWYSAALANALTGVDLGTSGTTQEINARFNINLGTPGCGEGFPFYLGLDNNHGSGTDLVTVLIHEFSHGLGFQTFTSVSTGTWNSGFPTIFDRFLFDNATAKTWAQSTMTDGERQASAISVNQLAWNGPTVSTDLQSVLATPLLRVNSPAGIAGNFAVGTAAFGAPLSFPGVTANVTQAAPVDGCTALTNGAAMSGRVALIDRGTCSFVVKVKNAQNAGAVGAIIVNTTTAGVVQMGGSDSTITIPSVSIADSDGNTIKAQLGAPVNATLLANTAVPSGVDSSGRALMFAPNPVQGGSSVSHWDTTAFPNQLMEPSINGDLSHSVVPVWDLTWSIFQDIGWRGNKIGDTQFFVRQHYLDFLNRFPDSSGLAFWNNQIVECGIDNTCIELRRINVSGAFFLSIEFQETGYLVYRFYKSAYGNIGPATPVPLTLGEFLPDTQQIGQGVVVGVGNWQAQLEANKQAFALAFVTRSRFTNAFPASLTPADFVDALFNRAGVSPSTSERNAAIAEFGGSANTADNGARARALRLVAENSQLKTLEFNKAFVLMQYFGYLRRNPNDAPEPGLNFDGYNFWLSKLLSHGGNFVQAEMVKAFIDSIEYRQRFGQ